MAIVCFTIIIETKFPILQKFALYMIIKMKIKKNDSSIFWTQEHIIDLITLYQNNDCLWNVQTEDYKCREKRDSAILSICRSLNISREQFSKKIHNLRNQFNYEAKKIHKRNDANNLYRSKWEYYEKLLFLKNVIAPRPGPNCVLNEYEINNQNKSECASDEAIKMDQTKQELVRILDTNSNGVSQSVFIYQEPTVPLDDRRTVKTQMINTGDIHQTDKIIDQSKLRYLTTAEQRSKISTRSKKRLVPPIANCETADLSKFEDNIHNSEMSNDAIVKKIVKNSPALNCFKTPQHSPKKNFKERQHQPFPSSKHRDEYDVFGEFVASELKCLSNDVSRKKLKRRILRAMLEIANEDDEFE